MSFGGKAMMVLGLVFLLASATTGWRAYRFVQTAQHAVGVVVRDGPGETGDRSPGHPIVEFNTQSGRVVRAFQHSGSSVPYGTRLTLDYAPDDPGDATVASFWAIWALPVVFLWWGAVLFVGPIFGLRPYLRT